MDPPKVCHTFFLPSFCKQLLSHLFLQIRYEKTVISMIFVIVSLLFPLTSSAIFLRIDNIISMRYSERELKIIKINKNTKNI